MPASAFCRRCGLPNPEGHRFCPRCGENLESASAGVPLTPTAAPGPTLPGTPPSSGYPYRPPRSADAVSIFQETFGAWGKDILAYLGLFLAYGLVTVGIELAITWALLGTAYPSTNFLVPSGSFLTSGLPVTYLYVILLSPGLSALVGALFTAVVTYYALSKRRGSRVSWSDAFQRGLGRYPSVLPGFLLLAVLGTVFAALEILPYVGGAVTTPNPVFLAAECGAILLVVPFLFLEISFSLYAPAAMMEDLGALASLRRSWALSRGYRLSIFGATLLVGLIAGAILFAVILGGVALQSPLISTAVVVAATALTGSWSVLLNAVAYELIIENRRAQAYQWGSMAYLPAAALPQQAPAYQVPQAPPCPVCRKALLWVPAYGRWYCATCRLYR